MAPTSLATLPWKFLQSWLSLFIVSVTFSNQSLNDRLADSGWSIANYVNFGLIGQGFAYPRLVKNRETGKIRVEVDKLRTIDTGVWGFKIKIDNTAIIHSIRLST